MSEIALPGGAVPGLPLAERLASDERLARLVARGSPQAFAVLYARHHRALSRYCRSIVRDEQDAQDALQSAMTRALAALQAGERAIAVRPWLFRIVHNEAISLLRRRRLDDVPVDEHVPARDGVERTVQTRERLALLVADLQTLPERQRAALVMRELSGLSIDELAEALDTSPGAAKQTLFEARSALHELAEGRAMECEAVRRVISERDGRMLRARKLRAHLRACPSCHEFRAAIDARSRALCALAPPLPAAAATALLARVLAGGAGGGPGGGAAVASSASVAGHAAGSLTSTWLGAKALAGVAVLTAVTAGTVQLATSTSPHRWRAPVAARATGATHGAVAARSASAAGAAHGLRALRRSRSDTALTPGGADAAAGATTAGGDSIAAAAPASRLTPTTGGRKASRGAARPAHRAPGAHGPSGRGRARSHAGAGASRGRGSTQAAAHGPGAPQVAAHEHTPPAASERGQAGAGGPSQAAAGPDRPALGAHAHGR